MVLVSNPRFLGMGNHLGPFSEASDRPEGQELGGGAVGGQQGLQSSSKAKLEIYDPQMVYYLLQPLQPILDRQVDLRLLKMVPNDSPYPKTLVLPPKPCL